jgi:tRNA(Ile)-lysidine synthase
MHHPQAAQAWVYSCGLVVYSREKAAFLAMPESSRNFPDPVASTWRKAAEQLARALPLERWHGRVLAWLKEQGRAKELWAVAVSGGADSVALLLLVWAHFPEARKRLTVLHYDHATRAESAADAEFVQGLAKSLGMKCATARRGAEGKDLSEAALREARWAFFREELRAAGARVIFLGQQRDDIVETMLMRLARGSGLGGLGAPRPVKVFADGVVALRPLLDIGAEELRAALREAGAVWREDSSNASEAYLRNRLRQQVVPAWRAAEGERDLAAGVARSRALLEEDDEALEAVAKALLAKPKRGEPLKLAGLAGQPRAAWRRVLRRWLEVQAVGQNISATAFEELQNALMAGEGGRWSAGRGCWLEASKGALAARSGAAKKSVKKSWKPVKLTPGKPARLPNGGLLYCTVADDPAVLVAALKAGRLEAGRHACLALAEGESPRLRARSWRPGDRYRPLGAPGRRKLQDLFTDKKIAVEERFMLPVVYSGDGQPVWVPGLPPAESRRVKPGARRALWLTYQPVKPIMYDSVGTDERTQ